MLEGVTYSWRLEILTMTYVIDEGYFILAGHLGKLLRLLRRTFS
jgi:hypothetical protein